MLGISGMVVGVEPLVMQLYCIAYTEDDSPSGGPNPHDAAYTACSLITDTFTLK